MPVRDQKSKILGEKSTTPHSGNKARVHSLPDTTYPMCASIRPPNGARPP